MGLDFSLFDIIRLIAYSAIWPIIIIGVIVYLIRRNRHRQISPSTQMFRIAFSREDALSQLYLLLTVIFFGLTLLAFNKEFNQPLSWQTVLFLSTLLGLYLGYKYKALFAVAVSLIGAVSWWISQGVEWADKYNVRAIPVLAGFILLSMIMYLLGHLHEQNPKWKRFSFLHIIFSIVFFTGTFFYLSLQIGLRSFAELLSGGSLLTSWELMLMLIAFLVALIVLYIMAINRKVILAPQSLAVAIITLFAVAILTLPSRDLFVNNYSAFNSYYYSSYLSEFTSIGFFWAVLFNVGVFLETLGIILVGYLRKESWHVTFGIVILSLLILVKYFDWFFDSANKSLFFLGAGVLMFVVGFLLERARRKVLSNMVFVPQPPKSPETNV